MIYTEFSNGFRDIYKGSRTIKAGWMITNRYSGAVLASGHSIDRQKASVTAEKKLQNIGHIVIPSEHELRYFEGPDYRDSVRARRAKREHNRKRLEFIRSKTKIEISEI